MKYILAADDELTNQVLLEELLSDNYEISVVDDGVACLESIDSRVPDLLLLDVSMPRMNGLDVCRSIRKNEAIKNMPIIILSASASQNDIDKGMKAGANSYITKPFSIDALISEIERILGN